MLTWEQAEKQILLCVDLIVNQPASFVNRLHSLNRIQSRITRRRATLQQQLDEEFPTEWTPELVKSELPLVLVQVGDKVAIGIIQCSDTAWPFIRV